MISRVGLSPDEALIEDLDAEIDRLRRVLHGLLNGAPEAEGEARALLYPSVRPAGPVIIDGHSVSDGEELRRHLDEMGYDE